MSRNHQKSLVIVGNSWESMIGFRGSLIRHLISEGWAVTSVAPGVSGEAASALRRLGAEPVELKLDRSGANPARELLTLWQLYRIIKRIGPNAVLGYFLKPSIYSVITAKFASVPKRIALIEGLGFSFRDTSSIGMRGALFKGFVSFMMRRSFRCASKVLVLNQDDEDELVRNGIVGSKSIDNVGAIGVDLDNIHYEPLHEGAPLFVLAARMIREKGVLEFVEAARRIKKYSSDVKFILLGGLDDNPSAISKSQIDDWMTEGVIEWPGRVNDVLPWLRIARAFVLPSFYREGVPRSIQEAMAVGRAIITTDNVGCRDTVEHGINGYLLEKNNVDQLEVAMRTLADRPDLAAMMGKESRRLAEAKFNQNRFNSKIAKILSELN